MGAFQVMDARDFNNNPFVLIGDEWMLITAAKDGMVNTMTASWGGLGVIWAQNVAYVFIRQSRYTKEFVDAADCFSLSFLDHTTYAWELGYLGAVSGRDEDKIKKANLSVRYHDQVPYFAEASKVLICRKLFAQRMAPESFASPETASKFYADEDYHDLYVGGIKTVLVRE